MLLRPSPLEFRRYAIALLAVAAAALLKILVSRTTGAELGVFRPFTLAVVVSAWVGGWGPGLLATALAFLAVRYGFGPRAGAPPSDLGATFDQCVFLAECTLICVLAHQLRTERSQGVINREQLRLLHDGIDNCAMFTLSPEGRIEDWNDRAEKMLGHAENEIVGADLARLYEEGDGAEGAPQRDLRQAADHGRVTVAGWRLRADGSRLWAETQLTALRTLQGALQGFAHVISDRSEERQAEDELKEYRGRLEELVAERTRALHDSMHRLRMSERMAALGTLSAGLGHDMGNLLLPIRLRLDAMNAKGVPESLREDVASIATCADYLQRLSNGLRLLSVDPSKTAASPPSTELEDWWRDVAPFLKNAVRKGIELEQSIAPGLPPVAVPRHLLTQAIFNLVQNAGHAIRPDDAGRVRIWADATPDGRNVRIGVTDNGAGMTEEVRTRCMEPFFTSKTRSISTGLGLTLVHGMVQQVSGKIEVESSPGDGTTFSMTLPIAPGPAAGGDRGRPRPLATIDLADTRMRTYVGAVLRSIGFDVTYAALAANEAQAALPNLLVADQRVKMGVIRKFVEANHRRRCVVFGRTPDGQAARQVLILDEKPSPAVVRTTFQEMAKEIVGGADGVCNDGGHTNTSPVR